MTWKWHTLIWPKVTIAMSVYLFEQAGQIHRCSQTSDFLQFLALFSCFLYGMTVINFRWMEVYPKKMDGTPHHAHDVKCTVHFFGGCRYTPKNYERYTHLALRARCEVPSIFLSIFDDFSEVTNAVKIKPSRKIPNIRYISLNSLNLHDHHIFNRINVWCHHVVDNQLFCHLQRIASISGT